MYFWNLRALKATMKERPMTDHEALPYYVVIAFLIALDRYASTYFEVSETSSSIDFLFDAFAEAIGLAGILWAYVRNGGRYGFSFFPRYFAIAWVVGIRLTVAIIAPFICLLGIFTAIEFYEISITDTVVDIVLNTFVFAIELIYCYLVARNVGEVADAWPKEGPPAIAHDAGNTPAISDVSAA